MRLQRVRSRSVHGSVKPSWQQDGVLRLFSREQPELPTCYNLHPPFLVSFHEVGLPENPIECWAAARKVFYARIQHWVSNIGRNNIGRNNIGTYNIGANNIGLYGITLGLY